MLQVAERLIPAYTRELQAAVAQAVATLPQGPERAALLRLRRRIGSWRHAERFETLRRLALLGEVEGWLPPEQGMVIRRLAHRVAFCFRRKEEQSNGIRRPEG